MKSNVQVVACGDLLLTALGVPWPYSYHRKFTGNLRREAHTVFITSHLMRKILLSIKPDFQHNLMLLFVKTYKNLMVTLKHIQIFNQTDRGVDAQT